VNDFFKYHGLGNDYLVIEPGRFLGKLSPAAVRLICNRNRGVGSDGILWGPLAAQDPAPRVSIFNPDGSEAEKSGNGLRIFARHLWERRLIAQRRFAIATLAGEVEVEVLDDTGSMIAIAMGQVRFDSQAIPMTGPAREVIRESLHAGGEVWTVTAANIGNPHCVVPVAEPSEALARRIGPLIERHESFPRRTNVQFMRKVDDHAIRIEIWERGAGYTSASGSSSCAAAAAARRLGLVQSPVSVHMPGGILRVELDLEDRARLTGPVAAVAHGDFHRDFLAELGLVRR